MSPNDQTALVAGRADEAGRSVTARRHPGCDSAHERIRRRAFELFLSRSGGPGDALSDWLEAERQVRGMEHCAGREDARAAERGEALLAGEND